MGNNNNKIVGMAVGFIAIVGLSGCFNPMERVQQEAGERLAEVLVEQAAGGDLDLDLEFDDESFSMTYQDENGETVDVNFESDGEEGSYTINSGDETMEINFDTDEDQGSYTIQTEDETLEFSTQYDEEIEVIDGMGFLIEIPDGASNGTLQQYEENGEAFSITAAFDIVDREGQAFVDDLHATLVAQGFIYEDIMGEADEPIITENGAFLMYSHPDGHSFNVIWGEDGAIMSLFAPTE